jgi:predicted RNA-binding Zn-ribbon protein involved in translation (DUF1610 family)
MDAHKSLHEWTPPPGFVSVPSKVPGIQVYAPAPPEEEQDEARTFRCPHCGGTISYSASDRQLTCPYCGYSQEVGAPVVGLAADRFEFTLETLDQAEKGWGVERRVVHCESCNAEFSTDGQTLSTTCPFCGSNRVVARAAVHEFIRPGYLIPFSVDVQQCRKAVREWLGRGWMYPSALRQVDAVDRFVGMYVPFWVFNARIAARWKAQVGHERQRRRYHNGKWETETDIEWRWENGSVGVPVENMLIYGTDKVSAVLLERLYPYNLGQLAVYDAGYLAGWQAQAYDIPLKAAWEIGKERMRERARDACYDDIASSHVRDFSMLADFDQERWRYVLLPVYLTTYAYEGETYHAMVNGQSGEVAGQKPVEWLRVWLAIGLLLLPGVLGGLLGLITLPVGMGVIVLPIAFFLFVLALLADIAIFVRARAADDI